MNNKKISHRREDIVKIRVSRNFADFTDKWPGPAHKVESENVQRNEHKQATPPIESACGKKQQSPHDTKTDYGVDNQSKCKPAGNSFCPYCDPHPATTKRWAPSSTRTSFP
jgi:hypothetical protein